MKKRLLRDEVPIEQTWDLSDLFPNDDAWNTEVDALVADISKITKYKGTLGESAKQLLHCLEDLDRYQQRIVRVSTFAYLRSATDATNPINQAHSSKVASAMAQISAGVSFFESEVLSIPEETLAQFMEQEQGLRDFQARLEKILQVRPHMLSPETESVLAALGEVLNAPYTIYSQSKATDMQFDSITNDKGETLPVSFALYETLYEQSTNNDERRKAYASFTKTLQSYKNTFAATYATEVKKQVALSRLRNYESVTHMLLQPQQVTMTMYENILNIIQAELAPHMRRLAKLRQRQLGLEEMRYCDLKAPIGQEEAAPISFAEASEMILEALAIMGPEYLDVMKKALAERWVDYSDNVGKRTGAFCSSPYGVHPYIMMTWTGKMRSVFTLAHELGHAGHFAMAGKYQRLSNTRPSMYFIEAPSTMNEMILGRHILSKTSDPKVRRTVILQFLGTYYHNFVTHMLEAELQRRVYAHAEAGKAITANVLSDLKGAVLTDFWGDAVVIDEGARLTWMRQPHYYMGLYPYTYAAGLTASTAVSQLIAEEGATAAQRWLEVLKAGGTLKPLDLMKKAGVDMSTPDPIRTAVAFVGSLIDELEDSFKEEM